MTAIRLVWNFHPSVARTLSPNRTDNAERAVGVSSAGFSLSLSQCENLKPAILVSYVYLEGFLKNRHLYDIRDWVLDSGAFSAHASGVEINLDDFIATAKELQANDPQLTEVFALDVIGDWRASLKNCEKMWGAGVQAIPCFHVGEPWDVLLSIARDYPKIALGGAVGFRDKENWAKQCFARVWPKKIHGFGFGSEKTIMALPFHSVDATNWELGPCKFGRWAAYGGSLRWRGSKQNLRVEVEHYLKIERAAQSRWKKEMALLESTESPTLRLAAAGQAERNGSLASPQVRLAIDPASAGGPEQRQRLKETGGAVRENGGGGLRSGATGESIAPTMRLAMRSSGREKTLGDK